MRLIVCVPLHRAVSLPSSISGVGCCGKERPGDVYTNRSHTSAALKQRSHLIRCRIFSISKIFASDAVGLEATSVSRSAWVTFCRQKHRSHSQLSPLQATSLQQYSTDLPPS